MREHPPEAAKVLIVCEKCGQTGKAASVDVVEGAVFLRCGHCGHSSPIAAQASPGVVGAEHPAMTGEAASIALPDAPTESMRGPSDVLDVSLERVTPEARVRELPPVKCPKCGHRQHETESCNRCGLTFALVADGSRPWEDFPPEQALHVPEARRLWQQVESAPDDIAAHSRFVEFCRDRGLITFAAMCYRHRLADVPDDAVSQSWLERVVRDATALAQAMRPQRDEFVDQLARLKQVLLVVVGILSVLAVVLMFRMMMVRTSLFD